MYGNTYTMYTYKNIIYIILYILYIAFLIKYDTLGGITELSRPDLV